MPRKSGLSEPVVLHKVGLWLLRLFQTHTTNDIVCTLEIFKVAHRIFNRKLLSRIGAKWQPWLHCIPRTTRGKSSCHSCVTFQICLMPMAVHLVSLGTSIIPLIPCWHDHHVTGLSISMSEHDTIHNRWTRCFRKVPSSQLRVHGFLPLSVLRKMMELSR